MEVDEGAERPNEFSEFDWHPENTIQCDSHAIRCFPSQSERVQTQWVAVDVWLAMRETGSSMTMLTAADKQKARDWTTPDLIYDIIWATSTSNDGGIFPFLSTLYF